MTRKKRNKPGMGKVKGNSYERECAKRLSLWLTDGKHDDRVWRSASSGGMATRRDDAGKDPGAHVGDLVPSGELNSQFFEMFCVECKRPAKIDWDRYFKYQKTATPNIQTYWQQAIRQAASVGKIPMLMIRCNHGDDLIGIGTYLVEKYIPTSMVLIDYGLWLVTADVFFAQYKDSGAFIQQCLSKLQEATEKTLVKREVKGEPS